MKKKPFLYLASQSPRRKEILHSMGFSFEVIPSSYHEKPKRVSPSELVLDHAVGKVRLAKLPKAPKGKVLGADTIVYCRGKVLGKPKSLKQALQMLGFIAGRSHSVYTGVAILDPLSGKIWKSYSKTSVFIKSLSKKEMLEYVKKVPPLDKAGAYAIQMKPKIVTKIQGSYSNVVGLPGDLVRKLLKMK